MPYPEKKERNKKVIYQREKLKLSFEKIAKNLKVSRNVPAKVYYRELERRRLASLTK